MACRQLGYPVAIRKSTGAEFGRGTGQIWLDNIECTGDEKTLVECSHRGWGVNSCDHSKDAGIVCNSKPLTRKELHVLPSIVCYLHLSRYIK